MRPDPDLHPLIAERWSPRAFDPDRPVSDEYLRRLFEAARWAPSCFNDQPWRFVVTRRGGGEDYARMLACLAEGNQTWAQTAPVLMLSCAARNFRRNGKPNRWGMHDVGLAVGNLLIQATALGLSVHQMAGFDAEAARAAFQIPDDMEPAAAIALGYRGDPSVLPRGKTEIDPSARERVPSSEIVFQDAWGRPMEEGR